MFCEDLEGWEGVVEGRSKRKGIYVYIWLIDSFELWCWEDS